MKKDVTKKSDQIRHGFVEDPTKGPRVEILIPAFHLQDRQRESSCSLHGRPWRQTRPGGPQDSGGSADTPAVFLSHDWGLHAPLAPLKLMLAPSLTSSSAGSQATSPPARSGAVSLLFHPVSYSALLSEKFSKILPLHMA